MKQGPKKRWLPWAEKTSGLPKEIRGVQVDSNLNKPKLLQFYREEVFRKHSSTGCTVGQVVHCIRAPAEEDNGSENSAHALPSRLYALVWSYVCSEEGVPFLICTKVPYGLPVALRCRTSDCILAFVFFCLDVLEVLPLLG